MMNFLKSSRNNKKTFFLHVPKTAGSRVRQLMVENYGSENFFELDGKPIGYISDNELNSYRAIAGHVGYGFLDRIKGDVTSFTFLRNPIKRVISHYYYWKNTPIETADPGAKLANRMTFDEFLESDYPLVHISMNNMQTWMMFFDSSMQTRKLHKDISDDELLDKAKKNLSQMSFVGVQENFTDSMKALEKLLGWKESEDIAVNVSKDKQPIEIPKKTMKKITECVSVDMELYEFACDISNIHCSKLLGT